MRMKRGTATRVSFPMVPKILAVSADQVIGVKVAKQNAEGRKAQGGAAQR